MKEIRWTDKVFLDSQGNVHDLNGEQIMTNKEIAIALLSEFKEKHLFYGKDRERDMNDTFDLAIKALEERPRSEVEDE